MAAGKISVASVALVALAVLAFNAYYWYLVSALGWLDNAVSSSVHSVVRLAPFVVTALILFYAQRSFGWSRERRIVTSLACAAICWLLGLYGPFVMCVLISGECV